jgi:hypothetical protein
MLSGGFTTDEAAADTVRVVASYPTDVQTWTVAGVNDSTSSRMLTAYVYCLAAETEGTLPGDTIQPSVAVTVNRGHAASATATCPNGEPESGGGFQVTTQYAADEVFVTDSEPQTGSWMSRATETSGSKADATLTAYAVCVTGKTTSLDSVLTSPLAANAADVGKASVSASGCTGDSFLAGGGFSMSADDAFRFQIDTGTVSNNQLTQWNVQVYNGSGSAASGIVYGLCL